MYPSQTSLIPIQIALAKFWESQGWRSIFQNYPYWYLGTTPYRYLTGPILPVVLSGLHRIFPRLTLFEIMFLLIGVAWLIGGIGVFLLVKALNNADTNADRRGSPAILSAIFYLFGPIVPFLFRFSDGLCLITFSFLPFTLLVYLKLLKEGTRKAAFILVLAMTFLLLLNTLIIPTLVLGMAAILLATTSWGKIEKVFKKSVFCLLSSVFFSTLWYTPGYWLTILGAPSFGGMMAVRVVEWLGKLLPTALAFVLAILSVKFFKKRKPLRDFAFYWLFIFSFLTLIRFLSDPDFWLDWSAYGVELQMGIGIMFGMLTFKILNFKLQKHILNFKNILYLLCVFTIYFLLFTVIFKNYVLGTLQKDITKTVEYRIANELVKVMKPEERVFLSGTTVFWLNAFFDISQVRGGVDQVSVDRNWRKAAWEIREGENSQKALEGLKKIKADYLVVHTKDSKEFYHDFKNPERFNGLKGLKKVYEDNGDIIFQLQD